MYQGAVAELVHGALLALPPGTDIAALGLRTEPGRMIAWTLQNYGAYIVRPRPLCAPSPRRLTICLKLIRQNGPI